MRLNLSSIQERESWEKAGFALPSFDAAEVHARTKSAPQWLHFGASNLFRAVAAAGAQRMLDAGAADTGIIVCEEYDGDLIDLAYRPYDCLSVLAILQSGGQMEKRVLASVAEALRIDGKCPRDDRRLEAVFTAPSLKLASFTISAKAYRLRNARGDYFPWVRRDMDGEPADARSRMGRLTYLLYKRFQAGESPIALVSMDNCPRNGDRLRDAILDVAGVWLFRGVVPQAFYDYLTNPQKVSFPLTMIDRMTPRPDPKVSQALKEAGLEDAGLLRTSRNARTAAFVNTEENGYVVIEDAFPAGRPPLEKAGFFLADRSTVLKTGRMKNCTCLSPVRAALSVLGFLLEYPTLAEEMNDPQLRELARRIALTEGMRVVSDPGVLSPQEYAERVISTRLTNSFLPDTPQRVATDLSLKLPIRYGETIKGYMESDTLDPRDLEAIPFVLAAYLRYLLGVDDQLKMFEPSPDPMLEILRDNLQPVLFGADLSQREIIEPILGDEALFGVDLNAAGLTDKIAKWFDRMVEGRGAVREALEELLEKK